MILIVGLGNPGTKYAHTRHNIGFMVVDQMAHVANAEFAPELKCKALIARDGNTLYAKPQTFMNLSGESVRAIMQFYRIAPDDVWVIFDDVDVPFGRLRIRLDGTSGHQGIRSIIGQIGTVFRRVRVGISLNDRAKEPSEEYVLKPFNPEEREQLPWIIERAAAVVMQQLDAEPTEATFDL